MSFFTVGKQFSPGKIVNLFVDERDSIDEYCNSHFRLILLSAGSIAIKTNEENISVSSPSLCSVSNTDVLTFKEGECINAHIIYFKPSVINSVFGDNYPNEHIIEQLSETEYQDLAWLEPFAGENQNTYKYMELSKETYGKYCQLFNLLKDELNLQRDDFWTCRSRSYFLEILYSMHQISAQYAIQEDKTSYDQQLCQRCINYIHNHYMERVHIKDLVNELGINRTKLNLLFTRNTGLSVIDYLIDYRLKLACLILRDTYKPIKEIAYQVGFNDLTNFGRTFKKRVGYSPTEYRKKFVDLNMI